MSIFLRKKPKKKESNHLDVVKHDNIQTPKIWVHLVSLFEQQFSHFKYIYIHFYPLFYRRVLQKITKISSPSILLNTLLIFLTLNIVLKSGPDRTVRPG